MSMDPILSLMGIALRGGNLVVGEEPVEAAARAKDARLLLLASDAADNTRRRVAHFADVGACIWVRIPFTKEDMGRAVGRTSVAVAAVTDIGLAAALAHKLSALDGPRFDETAQRLDLKARRAAERRQEQRSHEKNVRTGKYQKKLRRAAEEAGDGQKGAEQSAKKPSAPQKGAGKSYTGAKSAAKVPAGKRAEKAESTGPKQLRSRPSAASMEGRPSPDRRAKSGAQSRFAHSRPVKKGKGSVKKSRI